MPQKMEDHQNAILKDAVGSDVTTIVVARTIMGIFKCCIYLILADTQPQGGLWPSCVCTADHQ